MSNRVEGFTGTAPACTYTDTARAYTYTLERTSTSNSVAILRVKPHWHLHEPGPPPGAAARALAPLWLRGLLAPAWRCGRSAALLEPSCSRLAWRGPRCSARAFCSSLLCSSLGPRSESEPRTDAVIRWRLASPARLRPLSLSSRRLTRSRRARLLRLRLGAATLVEAVPSSLAARRGCGRRRRWRCSWRPPWRTSPTRTMMPRRVSRRPPPRRRSSSCILIARWQARQRGRRRAAAARPPAAAPGAAAEARRAAAASRRRQRPSHPQRRANPLLAAATSRARQRPSHPQPVWETLLQILWSRSCGRGQGPAASGIESGGWKHGRCHPI